MNVKLFTISSEEKSAKKLEYDTSCRVDNYVEDYDNTIVLRWGNSSKCYDKNGNSRDFKNVLNKADAIRINCVKDKALQLISKVALTPRVFRAGELVPKGTKIVYRSVEHSGGKDFRIMDGGNFKIEYCMYGKEFINTKKEWRVWFCNDQTMSALRFSHKDGLDKFCRSQWSYEYKKTPESLHRLAMDVKRVLDLDFGAIDILEKEGQYYVLENNTAATLDSKYLVHFYKINLEILMKKKFPRLI